MEMSIVNPDDFKTPAVCIEFDSMEEAQEWMLEQQALKGEVLTVAEHMLVSMLGSVMNQFSKVVGSNRTRTADMAEVAHHVHILQNMVLAQAAARVYPDQYRAMGEILRDE